jgi:hypothetical protein
MGPYRKSRLKSLIFQSADRSTTVDGTLFKAGRGGAVSWCGSAPRLRWNPPTLRAVGYGALRHLKDLPFVDGDRVEASRRYRSFPDQFRAAIAFFHIAATRSPNRSALRYSCNRSSRDPAAGPGFSSSPRTSPARAADPSRLHRPRRTHRTASPGRTSGLPLPPQAGGNRIGHWPRAASDCHSRSRPW